MQKLGLNDAERKAYHRALCAPYTVTIDVTFLDLNENPLESITPVVVSGQVTVDTSQAVTRMLNMEFLDPAYKLQVDTSQPSDGALFIDRLVQVTHTIYVAELGKFVSCKVFTGVPFKLSRRGPLVSIEAHGKERLALRPTWHAFSRGKNKNAANVLKEFLADRAGEGNFSFGDSQRKLRKHWTVSPKQIMWERAKHLANAIDRQLFYNGAGRCVLREFPGGYVLTFKPGDGGSLIADVGADTDVSDFANAAKFQGKKKMKPAVAKLPARNPMSASKLSRNGVLGVIAVFGGNSHVKKKAIANKKAHRLLDKQEGEVVSMSYDVLPFPHLDELDKVKVVTLNGASLIHRMTQWTIPLRTEGSQPMTVGYTKRLTPARDSIRKK